MPYRMCLLLGSSALFLATAVATPASSEEHQQTANLNRAQLEYRVMPRPNPHHRVVWVRRWVWDDFWGDYHIVWVPKVTAYRTVSYTRSHKTHPATMSDGSGDNTSPKSTDAADGDVIKSDKDIKTASLEKSTTPTQAAEKPVHVDLTKPVTPAEIRAAVPAARVANPGQTLASAPIKSLWGDTIGKVRGVDMNGANLKTVNAELGGKDVVKIDPSRLKYVKSRGLLITTLSKDDAAKLPKAEHS